MTFERWEQLKPLFDEAAEKPEVERALFIQEITRKDHELGDALRLLFNTNGEFVGLNDRPTIDGRDLFAAHKPAFAAGDLILSRFRIVRLIGSGGMGEVYEATDLELGRVALKTIRPEIAGDPHTFARFRKEVQLARKISGPTVCRIHELYVLPDSSGGLPHAFISMEFLDGVTLADTVRESAPMPWREAKRIGLEICDGLQAIHDAGIIHRDLKGRNIMLASRNGSTRAVVMDFGLAREISSPTSETVTEIGTAHGPVGTPGYMAPEQFTCDALTPATDIYALGVVLYELVTGKHPFPSSTAIGSAVQRGRRISLPSSIQPELPRNCDEIISKCLEFDPKRRYQSVNHLAAALRSHTVRPRGVVKTSLFALVALLLVLLGALYLTHRNSKAGHAPEPDNQDVRVSPLTALPGYVGSPALSPDGKQVVFAWDGGRNAARSMFNLYIKVIGAERIEQLTHQPAEAIIPAWSPDGSTIAFIRSNGPERGIFTMSVLGGPERRLDAFTDDLYGSANSLSWSADGRQIVYEAKNALRLLNVETGETRTIERPQQCKWAYLPVFSPDGKSIAFLCEATSGAVDLYRISPKSAQVKNLHTFVDEPLGIAWSGDGQRVVLADNDGLLTIGANGGLPRRLSFAQTAVAVGEQIASRGNRLVYVQLHDNVNIWRVDLKSGTTRSLLAPTSRDQRGPAISPDGKRIAFESDRSGTQEVWVANLDGSDAVQLSDFHALTGSPQWSPDGRRIAFDSRASGEAALYLVDPSTALPKRISTNGIPGCVPTWSADGKWIYFTTVSSQSIEHDSIYKVAPEGGIPELVTKNHGYDVQESKDGRVLYFYAGDTNAPIRALDKATGQEQPLKGMPNVGFPTDWAVGSKGIFYTDRTSTPAAVAFYEFSSARVTRRFPIEKGFEIWGGLALSPDETWIAYPEVDTRGSDLMLADGVQ
jgi:serine/threonine protein kinase/sugar lactone lactonase YvrE